MLSTSLCALTSCASWAPVPAKPVQTFQFACGEWMLSRLGSHGPYEAEVGNLGKTWAPVCSVPHTGIDLLFLTDWPRTQSQRPGDL